MSLYLQVPTHPKNLQTCWTPQSVYLEVSSSLSLSLFLSFSLSSLSLFHSFSLPLFLSFSLSLFLSFSHFFIDVQRSERQKRLESYDDHVGLCLPKSKPATKAQLQLTPQSRFLAVAPSPHHDESSAARCQGWAATAGRHGAVAP